MTSFLTPKQTADMMISVESVRLLAEKGDIPAELTKGGHRRFKKSDVESLMMQNQIKYRKNKVLRLLIVYDYDDQDLCEYLVDLLATTDLQLLIECAFDGFEAGKKISSFKPDIVLLDVFMPGMDGLSVCKILKNDPETSDIRIIGITGNPRCKAAMDMIEVGAVVCLEKPLDSALLVQYLNFDIYSEVIA